MRIFSYDSSAMVGPLARVDAVHLDEPEPADHAQKVRVFRGTDPLESCRLILHQGDHEV